MQVLRPIFRCASQFRSTNHRPTRFVQPLRFSSSIEDAKRNENLRSKPDENNITVKASQNKSLYNAVIDDNEEFMENEDNIYDREFVEMKVSDFEELYKDDETGSIKEKIETFLNEYEYLKYNSIGRVPSSIDTTEMHLILTEGTTLLQREKLINFLFKREMIKRNQKIKKAHDRTEKAAIVKAKRDGMSEKYGSARTGLLSDNGDLIYGLWHNNLFCRIPENKIKSRNSISNLTQSALYGRKLVFDFSFEEYMQPFTARNAADQVQESYGINRFDYEYPFDIWFCNFDENSAMGKYLGTKSMPNLHNGSMVTLKNDCFTNYFDRSRLVYLSPNATKSLEDINKSDDIYIIGAYNDKGSPKPLTYRKAEALGIRARKLPLDIHLAWNSGSKSLCMNHVTGILLEVLSNGGNWREAMMKHIPTRKIKPIELIVEEESRRLAKLRKKSKQVKFSIRNDFDM